MNFRTLKNLYKLTSKSPLEWLSDFLSNDEVGIEDLKLRCIELIYCMIDGDISLFELGELVSTENLIPIFNGLVNAIKLELTSEIKKEEDEDEPQSDDEDEEEDRIYNWNVFFNHSYYVALYELRKTEEEFLDMSIRELKTLDYYRKEYKKNILLDAYITVQKAKNKSSIKEIEEKKEATARNRVRIADLLMR